MSQNLDFSIIEVTTDNLSSVRDTFGQMEGQPGAGGLTKTSGVIGIGTNIVFVTDGVLSQIGSSLPPALYQAFGRSDAGRFVPASVLPGLKKILPTDPDLAGNLVFANDIENIIGGSGTNTFHFVNGARLQGSISGGTVVLDYSPDFKTPPVGNVGVTVDYQAGGDVELFQNAPAWVTTLFGDVIPHQWSLGSAQGVLGNRLFPGLTAFIGYLSNRPANAFGVAGGSNVIGSPYNDTLTGNRGDNLFVGGGGSDIVDGGLGSDTFSFAGSTSNATIDMFSGTAWEGGSRSFYFTTTQGVAPNHAVISRGAVTAGTFTLTLTGRNAGNTQDVTGTTAALQFNATAGQIRTALKNLNIPSVTDVSVSGTGTDADPWIVTLVNPVGGPLGKMTANSSALTGGTLSVTDGRSEVQRLWNTASQGFFSLSYNGNFTPGLPWNVPAADLETAFTALVGAPVTVTGDEVQNVTTSLASGTFTLSFKELDTSPAQQSVPVPWNATPAVLKAGLEALTLADGSKLAVSVTSPAAGQWLVSFRNPARRNLPLMTASLSTNIEPVRDGSPFWEITFPTAGDVPQLSTVDIGLQQAVTSVQTVTDGAPQALAAQTITLAADGALGGSFRLNVAGHDTVALPYDATAQQVRDAISTALALSSVNDLKGLQVLVNGVKGGPWDVVFRPKQDDGIDKEVNPGERKYTGVAVPLMTVVSAMATVTTTTEGVSGDAVQTVTRSSTPVPSFTLAFREMGSTTSKTTVPIGYNATSDEVRAALQGLKLDNGTSLVVDVTQTLTGVWKVTFHKPGSQAVPLMTAAGATVAETTPGSAGTAEVQQIVKADPGQFRLAFQGKLTAAINYDPAADLAEMASRVKFALEALALDDGTTLRVDVAGTVAGMWNVTFQSPKKDVPQLVPDSLGMVNGAVSVTNSTQGAAFSQGGVIINKAPVQMTGEIAYTGAIALREEVAISNNATSGTFKFEFDDPTTAGVMERSAEIPFNASLDQVKAALLSLPNIQGVTVTGSGTAYDPWVVEYTDPANRNLQQLGTQDVQMRRFNLPWSTIATTTEGTASSQEVQTLVNHAARGAFTITFAGQTTLPLAYNASAADVQTALNKLLPDIGKEVQKVTTTLTSGQFQLTFQESETATPKNTTNVAFNATAAEVKAALEALTLADGSNLSVDVTKSSTANEWTVTFKNPAATNLPLMTADTDTTVTAVEEGGRGDGRTLQPWSITFGWNENVPQITTNDYGFQVTSNVSTLTSIESLAGGKGNDLLLANGGTIYFANNWGDDLVVAQNAGETLDFNQVSVLVYPIRKVQQNPTLKSKFDNLLTKSPYSTSVDQMAAAESNDVHIFVSFGTNASGAKDETKLNRLIVYGGFASWEQKSNRGQPALPTTTAIGPAPLLAEEAGGGTSSGLLTEQELAPLRDAAIARWLAATGDDPQTAAYLQGLTFTIVDLGDRALAQTFNGTIRIDNDAAGNGWFLDATPGADEEFGVAGPGALRRADTTSPAYGHYDLLTVVTHEIGHALGLADQDQLGALMNRELGPGSRVNIAPADAAQMSPDAPTAGHQNGAPQTDQEKIIAGLGQVQTWSKSISGTLDTFATTAPALPFVSENLRNVWGITENEVATGVKETLIDPLQALFDANPSGVTAEQILAIPGISFSTSADPFTFTASIDLKTYTKDVALDFSDDALGRVLGLVVMPGETPSRTVTLQGTVNLTLTFGLDSSGLFVARQPELTAKVQLSQAEKFNLAVRLGSTGLGIENGTLGYQATVTWSTDGDLRPQDDGTLAGQWGAAVLDHSSNYRVDLPLVMRGSVEGFSSVSSPRIAGSNSAQDALVERSLAGVTLTSGGSGYTSAPSVAIVGGGGSGATATAAIANGAVTEITLVNAGFGYTSAPTVTLSGGGGSGAKATASLAGETVLSTFFEGLGHDVKGENMGELIEGKLVSLDGLLNGLKSSLTSLTEGSIGKTKLPIINKTPLEILGSGGRDVVGSITAAIDTVQEHLADMQSLEVDLNYAIAGALDLDLGMGAKTDVVGAQQALADVSFSLDGSSSDDDLTLALAATDPLFATLLADRDYSAASGRLSGLGLDGNSTGENLAAALIPATGDVHDLFTQLQADRHALAASSDYPDYASALARLQLLGLDGSASDAQIEAALDNAGQIALAKAMRTTVANDAGNPDLDDAGKRDLDFARNYLGSHGLGDNPTDAEINAALDHTADIAARKADRDFVYSFDANLLAALDRLGAHGLDGVSSDEAIATALVDPTPLAALKADRDLVRDSALVPAEVTPRLSAHHLTASSTELAIAQEVIASTTSTTSNTAAYDNLKTARDTVATYTQNRIVSLSYLHSALTVRFLFEKHLLPDTSVDFALDLADLAQQVNDPTLNALIGSGGLLSASAGGTLSVDAYARFSLGFTIDVSNLFAPQLYILDDTGIDLGLSAAGENLNLALGVNFGVGQLQVSAQDGTAHVDLQAHLGLDPAADGSGRYLVTQLGGNLDFSASGAAAVDLPLYFPTKTFPMGGTTRDANGDGYADNVLHIGTGFDSAGGFQGFEVVTPDLKSGSDLFALLNDPQFIVDSLNGVFNGVKGISSFFAGLHLPLIGDALKSAPDFVQDLQNLIVGDDDPATPQTGLAALLAPGIAQGKTTIEIMRQVIFDMLGQRLVVEEYDPATDEFSYRAATGPDDIPLIVTSDRIELGVLIKDTALNKTVGINFDKAIPGLGFSITGGVEVKLDYLFAFGFGFSTSDGFYLNTHGTAATGDELQLDLSVTLTPEGSAPTTLTGELAFVTLQMIDQVNDPDGLPSGVFGSLGIDLQGGTDGRLNVSHIGDLTYEVQFSSAVDLDLQTSVQAGGDFAQFDSILHYRQSLANVVWTSQAGGTVTWGDDPRIELENAHLKIADSVSLSGDFAYYRSQGKAYLGGTDITAFLGAGGTGVELTDGRVGAVFSQQTNSQGTPQTKYALVANGTAALVGIDGLTLSGTLAARVNRLGAAVDETIVTPGGAVAVKFDSAADVTELAGTVTLVTPVADLAGSFTLSKSVDPGSNAGSPADDIVTIEATASDVSAFVGDKKGTETTTDDVGVQISNAALAWKLVPDNSVTPATQQYALAASGTAALVGVPDLTLTGSLNVQKNTTGAAVNRSLTVGGVSKTLDLAAGISRVGGGVKLAVAGFAEVEGNFSVEKAADGSKLVIGAADINAFLGTGRDTAGTDDDLGLQVSGAQLGLMVYTPASGSSSYALSASGAVALVGLDGLQISGSVAVQANQTGRAVDETVQVLGTSVPVKFTTTDDVQAFQGDVVLTVGGVFQLGGALTATKTCSGAVLVDIPDMELSLLRDNVEVFGIGGKARFSIGGSDGFRLLDMGLTSVSVYGATLNATPGALPAMSTSGSGGASPPSGTFAAELASLPGLSVDAKLLNRRKYIDVTYFAPLGTNVDAASNQGRYRRGPSSLMSGPIPLSQHFDEFRHHVDAIVVITGQNNRLEVGVHWAKRNRLMAPRTVFGRLLCAAVTLQRESLTRFWVNLIAEPHQDHLAVARACHGTVKQAVCTVRNLWLHGFTRDPRHEHPSS